MTSLAERLMILCRHEREREQIQDRKISETVDRVLEDQKVCACGVDRANSIAGYH